MLATAPECDIEAVSLLNFRHQEIIARTPIDHSAYGSPFFENGFYQVRPHSITHPLIELLKSKVFRSIFHWVTAFKVALNEVNGKRDELSLDVLKKIVHFLLNNNATEVRFEATPDYSILLKAVIDNQSLYLDIYFDEEEARGYEAILNIFGEAAPDITWDGSLEYVFQKYASISEESVSD